MDFCKNNENNTLAKMISLNQTLRRDTFAGGNIYDFLEFGYFCESFCRKIIPINVIGTIFSCVVTDYLGNFFLYKFLIFRIPVTADIVLFLQYFAGVNTEIKSTHRL